MDDRHPIARTIARASERRRLPSTTDRPNETTDRTTARDHKKSIHSHYTYPQYDSTYTIQRLQKTKSVQSGKGKDSNRNGWMRTGVVPRASHARARRDSPQRHRLARRYLTTRTRGLYSIALERRTNERTNERHAGSDLRAHRAGWDPNGELVLGTVLSRTRDSTGVRVFLCV